jgi:hypothetical protein
LHAREIKSENWFVIIDKIWFAMFVGIFARKLQVKWSFTESTPAKLNPYHRLTTFTISHSRAVSGLQMVYDRFYFYFEQNELLGIETKFSPAALQQQCCQIFLCTTYQNGKIYQTNPKFTK